MKPQNKKNEITYTILERLMSVPPEIRISVVMLFMWHHDMIGFSQRQKLDYKNERNEISDIEAWLKKMPFEKSANNIHLIDVYHKDRRDREGYLIDIDFVTRFVARYYGGQ